MAQAALILAGDINLSPVSKNAGFVRVLKSAANDRLLVEECCEVSEETSELFRFAPAIKSDGSLRNHTHLHPALGLRWCTYGERLLPYYRTLIQRPSPCCSNRRTNSEATVATDGLLRHCYEYFVARQQKALQTKRFMGVLDIRNFYPSVTGEQIRALLPIVVDDEALVNDIASTIERLGFGLPQDSATSQMTAELILSVVDTEITTAGIDFLRFVDDYRISGNSRREVSTAIETTIRILDEFGFEVNENKVFNHSSRRASLLPVIGGCCGSVPVEMYVENKNDQELPIILDSLYGSDRPYGFKIQNSAPALDIEKMFHDHILRNSHKVTDALERYVVRNLAARNSQTFRQNEIDLAVNRLGLEKVYSKIVLEENSYLIGEAILQVGAQPAFVNQRRAVYFFSNGLKFPGSTAQSQRALVEMFESNPSLELETELCSLFHLRPNNYNSRLPYVRRGLLSGWPDEAVARLMPLSNAEKIERNRVFLMASKARPALAVAVKLLSA